VRRLVLYLALCLILAACTGAEASEHRAAVAVETPTPPHPAPTPPAELAPVPAGYPAPGTRTPPTTVVVVTNGGRAGLADPSRHLSSRGLDPARIEIPTAVPTATPIPPTPTPRPPPPTATPRSPSVLPPFPPDLASRTDVHWLPVPYRSQLDGSPYEQANCGPTSMAMVLAAYGKDVPTLEVRTLVNKLQGTEGMTDVGTLIQSLHGVAQRYGLKPSGLFGSTQKSFHHWTLDEVRQTLDAGKPIIPQVWYRGLPGRENKAYNGDHYIVLVGYVGDEFIYNDPIDKDAPGYARRMSAAQLDKAWRNSDFPYAAVAIGGPTDRPSLPKP
jgi:uncharacterized protein YvpB